MVDKFVMTFFLLLILFEVIIGLMLVLIVCLKAKAYDSIEWPFLKCVMQEMSFAFKFINWVMNCVSTVSYSILINGFACIPFRAQKGLRQGDPMSSFLFALSMEYFRRCLKRKKGDIIKLHPKCKCSEVMELLFVDDLLVFLKANLLSMHALNLVLDVYGFWSLYY